MFGLLGGPRATTLESVQRRLLRHRMLPNFVRSLCTKRDGKERAFRIGLTCSWCDEEFPLTDGEQFAQQSSERRKSDPTSIVRRTQVHLKSAPAGVVNVWYLSAISCQDFTTFTPPPRQISPIPSTFPSMLFIDYNVDLANTARRSENVFNLFTFHLFLFSTLHYYPGTSLCVCPFASSPDYAKTT